MACGCDELVDALLQAASGSTSSKSIRERGGALLVRIVCYLLLCRGAALFLGARGRDGVELRLLRGHDRHTRTIGVILEVATGKADDIDQPL
ncbi:Uncharacterised protein [Burkholderia cepacia]|uniref:Uncharacterized protein n=1 Tax=Burkholderia cepacia TaxID=292 RepID=A0AAE8NC17_BURCE|nr:hypothetical protein CSX04_06614 [Burkholderia cepacia]SPV16679.1 Uncharacterised protein [Burkholderia cepacia]